ncbi:MAG TPA: hypothetical protein VNG91_05660 [Terriglobia bacterium]|nr:hypothetical protein [Terriglobia bacterium]
MKTKALTGARAFLQKLASFPALCGMLLVLEVWATLPLFIHDPDLWWHIAVGAKILRTHAWPTFDPYSFTAHGNPWIAYEWLGEVVIALAAHSGAMLAGLAWLRVGLAGLLMLLLYYYACLRCRNSTAAFLATALVYLTAYGFLTLRPQLLGYIFLMITLISLERFRLKQQKSLWLLPVVFMLWVNTHGTFVLGLGIIALYWLSGVWEWQHGDLETSRWTRQERQHLAIVSLLCVLALLITPYGSRLAAYPFEMLLFQNFIVSHVPEWGAIRFTGMWSRSALVLVLLLFLSVLVFRPRWRLEEMVLFPATFYEACIHRRMFVVFTLIFVPLLASEVARWVPDLGLRWKRTALNASLMVLLAAGMLTLFPSHQELEEPINQMFPVAAVQYLQSHPVPGPMFNYYMWGGYLIWKFGGRHRVFIDGRADIYAYSGVFADYAAIVSLSPQTLFLLRKYSIRSCLLTREDHLGTFLAALPDWRRVYEDDVSVLYVRQSSAPSSNSARAGGSEALRSGATSGKLSGPYPQRSVSD